jgi:hypothetical protein
MKTFYQDFGEEVQEILDFEKSKFTDDRNRYAWKIRSEYANSYARKGLALARQRQEEANV